MDTLKVNKARAKELGAISGKDAEPGQILVRCYNSQIMVVPTDSDELNQFRRMNDREYFKVATPEVMPLVEEAKQIQDEMHALKKQMDELEKKSVEKRKELQDFISGEFKTKLVFWFYREQDAKMTVEEVKEILRPGDNLLNFGLRYNNNKSCWIAIVEIPGLLTNTVFRHYSKQRFDYSEINSKKPNDIADISKTGFAKKNSTFAEAMVEVLL